jgi:hypothetical protein
LNHNPGLGALITVGKAAAELLDFYLAKNLQRSFTSP